MVTLDDFLDRAESAALPAKNAPSLDPISLLILTSALASVVGWLVERCLNHFWPENARNPTRFQRARLRLMYVNPAVRQAIEKTNGASHVDRQAMEERVMEGLLTAAKGLSDADFEALRSTARAAR